MFILLAFLCFLIAAGLILAVVVQNSKGGGLSSAIVGGGATQILGSRRSAEMIEKITWYLAGALAVFAFVANIIISQPIDEEARLRIRGPIENQVISSTPVPPPSNAEIQNIIDEAEKSGAEAPGDP
jgi:preprotein translocase subunit SecG